jgi:hypothetical protein
MILLPNMRIGQGEPFAYAATVQGQDWTGYTGTATFKASPKAKWRVSTDWPWGYTQEPFLTATVTGQNDGQIDFALTSTETDLFPALPRLGYRRQAVCEIAMTNGADTQRFQAWVSVAARI